MHSSGYRACITYNVELITHLTMPFFYATHITNFWGAGKEALQDFRIVWHIFKNRLSLVAAFTRLFWSKYVLKDKMLSRDVKEKVFEDTNYIKYPTKQFWFLSSHNSWRNTLKIVQSLTIFIIQKKGGTCCQTALCI